MTSEADFRASLPADGSWSINQRGSMIEAADSTGRYSPRYYDMRSGKISSRTSGRLRG